MNKFVPACTMLIASLAHAGSFDERVAIAKAAEADAKYAACESAGTR